MVTNRRDFLKYVVTTGTAAQLAPTPAAFDCSSTVTLPRREDFFKAITAGDVKTVKRMLAADANLIHAKDTSQRSGFLIAILNDHQPVAKLLSDAGYQADLHEAACARDWERFDALADAAGEKITTTVNQDHPVGGTAMYAAARGGAGADMWRVYARCGRPNDVPSKSHRISPLQIALRYKDLTVAELSAAALLANDANPNPDCPGDETPLQIAVGRGSSELAEMLIRLGANVEASDKQYRTPLEVATKNKDEAMIHLLENHRQIPRTCRTSRQAFTRDSKKYTAPDWDGLSYFDIRSVVGSAHRDLDRVRTMVESDPRMAHAVATTSEKAVEAAAHMGQKPIAEFLLEHGAPYSLPTAVMMEDYATTTRLLDEDPDRIHERGAHDFALLWYPIIGRCKPEMMELLLKRGSKVEEQHHLGTTALHWACRNDDLPLVELLVHNGANVNRIGRKFGGQETTPLQSTRDPKVAEYLKSNGAKSK